MSRLPTVGEDNDVWGSVLNEYLEVSHTPEGKNKPQVTSIVYAPSITPDIDTTEILTIGALTGDITITNPTGTPIDGQLLTLRLSQDSIGGRILTFGDSYIYEPASIPTTSNAKWEMFFRYSLASTKWEDTNTSGLSVESVSRTIYVATTGSDTTGNGSVGLPYATVGKALNNIKKIINPSVSVTIHLVSGNYSISTDDLNIISSFDGLGTLILEGEMTLVESGFTMGSAQALDPLTYAVSGGNTGSWSANQWKYYFLKNGNNYIPITESTNSTLSVVYPLSGTEIYQTTSIITINHPLAFTFTHKIFLNFYKLNLLFTANNFRFYNSIAFVYFMETKLESSDSTNRTIIFGGIGIQGTGSFYKSILKNIPVYVYGNLAGMQRVFSSVNSVYCFILASRFEDYQYALFFNSIVFENLNTAATSAGVIVQRGNMSCLYSLTSNEYIKFQNTVSCFKTGVRSKIELKEPGFGFYILKNCNYFVAKVAENLDYDTLTFRCLYSSIKGTLNTRWFYDNIFEFANLTSGRNIQITGLLYPEFEQNLSSALTDNTTTNIIVGNKLQNRSIVIDYTITRGTTYETAQLRILNDGTNLTLQEATPLGDVGVTFAVNFNTNEIRLACTLTSTGTPATMKYNATRVMITPLTI